MGVISAWKILSLIGSEISLLQRDFLFLLKAAQANCFLLQMSSLFPNRLPKYLHFFHSGLEVLLMLYSSVLSSLTIRFLFVRIPGTICLISSMVSLLVVAQEVSSAYCCSMVKDF